MHMTARPRQFHMIGLMNTSLQVSSRKSGAWRRIRPRSLARLQQLQLLFRRCHRNTYVVTIAELRALHVRRMTFRHPYANIRRWKNGDVGRCSWLGNSRPWMARPRFREQSADALLQPPATGPSGTVTGMAAAAAHMRPR